MNDFWNSHFGLRINIKNAEGDVLEATDSDFFRNTIRSLAAGFILKMYIHVDALFLVRFCMIFGILILD